MRIESTSVLVLGGGLVGLSAATFLAWRGVPTVLVEKHEGSSPHPRAAGFTPRTTELYRAVGLAEAFPVLPKERSVRRVRARSLAGEWFEEQHWTPPAEQASVTIDYSPVSGVGLTQDQLEPLLRAHADRLPPNRGAYSANSGIEDVHNLAWKLAEVLSSRSGPDLLDSYEAERRPIALLCHEQIFARTDPDEHTPIIDDEAMAFGYLYRSPILPDADPNLPAAQRPEIWAGQPGTRAPHLWLSRSGSHLSTLDVLQGGWVLLGEAGLWRHAARRTTETLGIPVTYQQLGVDSSRGQPVWQMSRRGHAARHHGRGVWSSS